MDIALQCIRRKDAVLVKEVESKTVLLNLATGTYYTLNKAGTVLWSCADGKKTVSEMAGELVGRYHVSPEVALQDTVALVQALAREGLIELVDSFSEK